MHTSYSKVIDAQEAAEEERDRYLRSRGWEHTCDNPACTWLWQKPLPDGRIVLVDGDTALSLQSRADGISLSHWPKPAKAALPA